MSATSTSTARKAAHGLGEKPGAAFDAAIGGTKVKVATKLKENKQIIAFVLGQDAGKLTDDVIAHMADDWVEKEEFNVGGKKYTREQIRQSLVDKAKSLGPLASQFASRMGVDLTKPASVSAALDKMLPGSDTLSLPAKRLSEEVHKKEQNSGFMDAVKGFFSWLGALLAYVFSGFSEDKKPGSITDHIYRGAGQTIADNFVQQLEQDRKVNPALAAMLSPTDLQDMHRQAVEGVVAAGRGEQKAPVTVDSIKAGLGAVKPLVTAAPGVGMMNIDQIKQWGQTFIEQKLTAFLDTPANFRDPKDPSRKNVWEQAAEEATKNPSTIKERLAAAAGMITAERVRNQVRSELMPKRAAIAKTMVDGLMQGAVTVTDEQLASKEKLTEHLAAKAIEGLKADKEWQKGLDPRLVTQVQDNVRTQVQELVSQNFDLIKGNKSMIRQIINGMKDPKLASSRGAGQGATQDVMSTLASLNPLEGVLPVVGMMGQGAQALQQTVGGVITTARGMVGV